MPYHSLHTSGASPDPDRSSRTHSAPDPCFLLHCPVPSDSPRQISYLPRKASLLHQSCFRHTDHPCISPFPLLPDALPFSWQHAPLPWHDQSLPESLHCRNHHSASCFSTAEPHDVPDLPPASLQGKFCSAEFSWIDS